METWTRVRPINGPRAAMRETPVLCFAMAMRNASNVLKQSIRQTTFGCAAGTMIISTMPPSTHIPPPPQRKEKRLILSDLMFAMTEPAITPELIQKHNLARDEFEKIKSILGREPNYTE